MLARVLAVADAYDAMSNCRPYRESLPYEQVEQVLVQGAGSQWDRQVVEAFLRCRERIRSITSRGSEASLRQAIEGALRSSFNADKLPQAPHLQILSKLSASRCMLDS